MSKTTVPENAVALTTTNDEIVGDATDNFYTAITSAVEGESTLNAGDYVDAGDGDDTLQVSLGADFNGFNVESSGLQAIEMIELNNVSANALVFDTSGIHGAQVYSLTSQQGQVISLAGLDNTDVLVKASDMTQGTLSIGFAVEVTDGEADALSLSLRDVGSEAEHVALEINNIESLELDVTGDNFLSLEALGSDSLVVSGEGSLSIVNLASVALVDAAAMTGDLSLVLSASEEGSRDLRGGAGDDVFALDVGRTGFTSIDGGAGKNTLRLSGASESTGALAFDLQGITTIELDAITSSFSLSTSEVPLGVELLEIQENGLAADTTASFNNIFTAPAVKITTYGNQQAATIYPGLEAAELVEFSTVASAAAQASKVAADEVALKVMPPPVYREVSFASSVSESAPPPSAGIGEVNIGAYTTFIGELDIQGSVTLNVASGRDDDGNELTSFNGFLGVYDGDYLRISADGLMGPHAVVDTTAADLQIKLEQGGALQLYSEASDVLLESRGDVDLKETFIDYAKNARLTAISGHINGAGSLLGVGTLTLGGEDATSQISLGPIFQIEEGGGQSITASGLAAGLVIGNMVADMSDLVLNVANVSGDVTTGAIVTQNDKDAAVIASKTGGTHIAQITGFGEANITVDASNTSGAHGETGKAVSVGDITVLPVDAESGASQLFGRIGITLNGTGSVAFGDLTAHTVIVDAKGYTAGAIGGEGSPAASFGAITANNILLKGSSSQSNNFIVAGLGVDNGYNWVTLLGGASSDSLTINQEVRADQVVVVRFDDKTASDNDTLYINESMALYNPLSRFNVTGVENVAIAEGKEVSFVGVSASHTYTVTSGTLSMLGTAGGNFIDASNTGRTGSGVVQIIGFDGNDIIFAGSGGQDVYAGDGDDYIRGGVGDDYLDGYWGKDDIFGADGDDTIFGQDGADDLYGGAGSDSLYGGADNDRLLGDAGDDFLYGGAGADKLEGGAGSDYLEGGDGKDNLQGGEGDDHLIGDNGFSYSEIYVAYSISDQESTSEINYDFDDVLVGGDGNDTLEGGAGADTLTGGAGVDRFVFGGDYYYGPVQSSVSAPDKITDFNAGGTEWIDFQVNLYKSVSYESSGEGEASIDAGGKATFNAADGTLSDKIGAVARTLDLLAGGGYSPDHGGGDTFDGGYYYGSAAGAAAFFEHSGDTFVFVAGYETGYAEDDSLIVLQSKTGYSSLLEYNGNISLSNEPAQYG